MLNNLERWAIVDGESIVRVDFNMLRSIPEYGLLEIVAPVSDRSVCARCNAEWELGQSEVVGEASKLSPQVGNYPLVYIFSTKHHLTNYAFFSIRF